MITLKKSFELQNYIKDLFNQTLSILGSNDATTVTVENHFRNAVYSKASDEKIKKPKAREYDFTINELIDFDLFLQNEFEQLTSAINIAKTQSNKDFDGLISVNSRKRQLLTIFERLSNIKSTEKKLIGRAPKFNEEGNQVYYDYNIESVTTIDFDRNAVRKYIKKIRNELEKTSDEIELLQISTKVDFSTILEIGDSLEDAISKWKETLK